MVRVRGARTCEKRGKFKVAKKSKRVANKLPRRGREFHNARAREVGGIAARGRTLARFTSSGPSRPSARAPRAPPSPGRRTRRFASLGRPTSGKMSRSPEDARRAAEIERMVAEFSSPSVPEITADALMAEMLDAGTGNKPYVLVDVRTADERAVSSIPGSVSSAEYESDFDAKYCDERVVAYCTIGYRSGKYVEKLIEEKGVDAYNLRGSVLAWTHAGGELVDGGGSGAPTTRVHTFGKKWALARSGYDSVWFNVPVVSYVNNLLFKRR